MDDGGKLQIRKDVYGRDAQMIALLKGSRSKDLENVNRPLAAERRPAERLGPALQRRVQ